MASEKLPWGGRYAREGEDGGVTQEPELGEVMRARSGRVFGAPLDAAGEVDGVLQSRTKMTRRDGTLGLRTLQSWLP